MNILKFKNVLFSVALIAIAIVGFSVSNEILAQKPAKKTKMDTPSITAVGMGESYIDIQFTAGSPSGAPAGFSLQWMTAADFAANGNQWFLSEDPRLCKASFSGNANLSRYNLSAGQSVVVRVGDFLFDNGASTNCAGVLICDTEYVFRAFSHADNTLQRSDFTGNLFKRTSSCGDDVGGCTYTQGYWKTHGPIPTGNNSNQWLIAPGDYLLGNPAYSYTDLEWLSIFNTPPAKGNGLLSLAHQLMAAKLNVANGAETTPGVLQAIVDSDNLIGNRVVPPVGNGFIAADTVSNLATLLNTYNNGGLTVAGHCNDEVPE